MSPGLKSTLAIYCDAPALVKPKQTNTIHRKPKLKLQNLRCEMYLPGRKQKSKPLGRYRKHLKCNFEAKHGSTHLPSGGLGRCTSLDSGRARMHPRAGSVVVLSKLQKPSLSCTLPPFQLWTPLPHSSDRSIICKAFLSFLPPPSLPALSQSSDFFEASSEELWMLAQYCRGMECLQCRVSLVV